MGSIFKILGDSLGYIMLFFLQLTKNYGIAIILFTIFIKTLMIPLDISRQKSMARNSKFSKKQAALKQKHKNDKVKLNEEMTKLYEKEGVSPFGGCVSMILPLFIVLGIFSAVSSPLTSTFHFPEDVVSQAQTVVKDNPEIDNLSNSRYPQIEVFNIYLQKPEYFPMFSEEQTSTLDEYSNSFTWLGLNLFDTPKSSPFSSMLWMIPFLCMITSIFSTFLLQKAQGASAQVNGGCMKAFSYSTALLSAWFAYAAPAAVGLYWIASTIFGIGQALICNRVYSVENISAKEEAARVALLIEKESL